MNWTIEHQCPQCGAPVVLDEADRLLSCRFCRTRLYLASADHFRYQFPAAENDGRPIMYIPYWHLRGLSYRVHRNGIASRFIDTSLLAAEAAGLPRSLGVRPQTLNLKFVSPAMKGRFLETRRPSRMVFPAGDLPEPGGKAFLQAFIGELISLVYAPAYLDDGKLYDALLRRPLSAWTDDMAATAEADSPPDWQVRFLPTFCPHCGWDLQGEKDALVLTCRQCDGAWRYDGTVLTEVPFEVYAAAGSDTVYLPFWRMKPRAEGMALDSYGDLIRLANLPRVVTPESESAALHFWSPAFKINPALFLRWSRQMTVFQPRGKTTAGFAGAPCYPVTLAAAEAVEGMKITLAELAVDKRTLYPALESLRLTAAETRLVYHPFAVGSRELIHETMQLTLDRTALKYGSYL